MFGYQSYKPAAQVALPGSSGSLQQVPVSWPFAQQLTTGNEFVQSNMAAALQAIAVPPTQASNVSVPVPCEPLDDFADCMSDLSDLDRCSATPSMSSVYELSCALSPASSADSLFSSEYERTSPLSHYPMPSAQESVPTTNYSSFVQSPELVASTCSAVEEVVQRDLKPLLRKPIDTTSLDRRQMQRLLRRRERNKIAASKCRRKTKEKAASIREQLDSTAALNAELQREVEQLRAEKARLERIVASHNCVLPGCGEEEPSIVTPPCTPPANKTEA